MIKYIFITLFIALSSASSVFAGCVANSTNERLSNFCLAQTVARYGADLQTIHIVDERLKREGYDTGWGLPKLVDPTQVIYSFAPLLDYSTNINGGNPNRTLVLNGLEFEGDPRLVKKDGFLIGARLGLSARSIFGQGHYVDYSFYGSYQHSAEHSIGVLQYGGSACSKNDLGQLTYLDVCANLSSQKKDLADQHTKSIDAKISRLFRSKSGSFHELSVGLKRLELNSDAQSQMAFGLDTILANGSFLAVKAQLGEKIIDEMALRQAAYLSWGHILWNKPMSLSVGVSKSSGSSMIGVKRADNTRSIAVSYSVTPRISLILGYEVTDSSIDYFDNESPKIGIQFTAIKF